MTEIRGDDTDRIAAEISDWSNPAELKQALMQRFPKWKEDRSGGRKRLSKFAERILDRLRWYESEEGITYVAVQDRTGFAGKTKHRIEMITDMAGKYLGKPENVQTYHRHGKLYGKNKNTGRRARIA